MLPPFPQDVPAHPLLIIDYDRIVAGDKDEIELLWDAATKLGFWYLKNHGVDAEAEAMFEMGKETMALPLEEKLKYEQGESGIYKAAGANATDEYGNLDAVEYLNVAKDDALAYPRVVHRSYPPTVNARIEDIVKPFVLKSLQVNQTLLRVLGQKLGLPEGALERRHTLEELSGCETRCTKVAARTEPTRVALGGHTDFGSLSFLHNRLGGLQVLAPGTDSWRYVKPIPGHAICNVGDALALLSGGVLRSNMHRVVPPPGEQYGHERWSLVYFTRPGDSVPLKALTEESALIKDAVDRLSPAETAKYEGSATAREWFARRTRNQRAKNQSGADTWRASRGTEHQPDRS
ncbi:Clavaminate synthase-like protein [Punctularia strigosozonata HHB-11173 SS5]|uniref:Clavaminate synthase-like protein n=1 Tax=Punctularia strigosozonata (strain HHB-11173) TaxID=741275 RepID=UPI0004417CE1|nr:Clavaminate synthase-like protein [Punctularia strigosozonata HHB-11173 SS5]EIN05631.1 Clavaminate synthase-like protein [Punctularia strigosozonata HHB-11173 SS5]